MSISPRSSSPIVDGGLTFRPASSIARTGRFFEISPGPAIETRPQAPTLAVFELLEPRSPWPEMVSPVIWLGVRNGVRSVVPGR